MYRVQWDEIENLAETGEEFAKLLQYYLWISYCDLCAFCWSPAILSKCRCPEPFNRGAFWETEVMFDMNSESLGWALLGSILSSWFWLLGVNLPSVLNFSLNFSRLSLSLVFLFVCLTIIMLLFSVLSGLRPLSSFAGRCAPVPLSLIIPPTTQINMWVTLFSQEQEYGLSHLCKPWPKWTVLWAWFGKGH